MDKGKRKRLARSRVRNNKGRTFDYLPVEVLAIISSYLSDPDIPYFAAVCKQFHHGLHFAKREYKFGDECIYSSLSRVEFIPDFRSKIEVWNKCIVYGNLDILQTIEERPFSSLDVYTALLHGHVHVAEFLCKIGIIHDCPPGTNCLHIRKDLILEPEHQLNILATGNHKSIVWSRKHGLIKKHKLRSSMNAMIKQKNIPSIRYLLDNFDDYRIFNPYAYIYLAIDTNNIEVYSYFESFIPYPSQILYAINHRRHNIIRHILHRVDLDFLRSAIRYYIFLQRDASLEFSIMHIFAMYDDLEGIQKALNLGLSIDLRHILIECGRRNSINVFEYVLSLCPYDMDNLHQIVHSMLFFNTKEPQFGCLSLLYKKEWKYKLDKNKMSNTILFLRKRNTIDSSNILELIDNHQ